MSWLAPALAGDLGELEHQLPPGAGLEGVVRPTATGGADVRCLLATPQEAAGLLPQGRATLQRSLAPAAMVPAARPTTLAPARNHASSPSPARRGVNPAQLTLEDAVAGANAGDRAGAGPEASASLQAPGPAASASLGAPTPLAARPVAVVSPATIELETVSYSSLKELERCGYRYYLERVLGLEERGVEDPSGERRNEALDALSRGSLVHRVLELHDFATAGGPTPQEVEQAALGLGLDPAAGDLREIAELLGAALREPPAQRIAAAAEVWREHPFAYPVGEELPLLTGVIDMLAREHDDGYLVVDYKSDAVAEEDELEELVVRDYALQRELYALAVLRTGAQRVEVQHWFLGRPHEPASARFEAAELQRLQGSLQQRLRRALEGGFAVSAQPHRGLCATCPGRSRLCSWPESATMAPEPPRTACGG